MRILIYGAGAIGGYLGAHLAEVGHDITLIARARMIERMQTEGLILNEVRGFGRTPEDEILRSKPHAFGSLKAAVRSGAQPWQMIVLTVKSFDVADSISEILEWTPDVPMVIACQNGIGVIESIVERMGPQRVTAASVTAPVRFADDGSLYVERPASGIALAPTAKDININYWYNIFDQTAVNTTMVESYSSMKWSKAFLNIIANSSSAILNWHPEKIYKHQQLFDMELGMLKEMLAVMKKLRIKVVNLPGVPAKTLARSVLYMPRPILKPLLTKQVGQGRGEKMPSFNLDLLAGKPRSEVVYLNQAIARLGKEHGVPTPINYTLGHVLMQLVDGEIDLARFQDQPEPLLQLIHDNRLKMSAP